MHVSFKIRHSKNPTLPSTIYARVSVAGTISDISTLVKTYRDFWTGQKIRGGEDSKKLNMKLQKVKSNLFAIYDAMLATEPENITAFAITDIYTNKKDFGVKKEKITLWKACNLYFEKKYTSKRVQPKMVVKRPLKENTLF